MAAKTLSDEEFIAIQAKLEAGRLDRQVMIETLKPIMSNLAIDFKQDGARTIEVKLQLVKTLDDLIKGQDTSVINEAKLQLQRVETDTNANVQEVVIQMLQKIRVNDNNAYDLANSMATVSNAECDKLLEAKLQEAAIDIKAEELQEVTA